MLRRLLMLVLTSSLIPLFSIGVLPLSGASAASGPDCTWYDYQSDAQDDYDEVLENYPEIIDVYEAYDEDGDGIACSELPQRPEVIAETVRVRGHFDPKLDYLGLDVVGYSAWYVAQLAGVSLDPKTGVRIDQIACLDLVSNTVIAELFALPEGTARQYYLVSSSSDPLPPGDSDGHFDVDVLAWTVMDDSANPVLLNEWLVRNGLAFVDSKTAPAEIADDLEAAQEAAKSEGLGVWGACELPGEVATGSSPTEPTGQVLNKDSRGDQIATFSIEDEGLYLLTLEANEENAVFVAVDVYTMTGDRLPEFGVSTSESGQFTSAGFLPSGDYYIQVTAIGGWRVTIEPLE